MDDSQNLVRTSHSFGLVDNKVQEVEFFFDKLAQCNDFFAARCFSVAFANSARGMTYSMQASLTGLPGFDQWYTAKQAQLKTDSLAKFFHDFRRISHHIGEHVVNGGTLCNGKMLFYFAAVPDLPTVPSCDVVTACRNYFITLLEIVFDCYLAFGPDIDAHLHYTQEHFASIGKNIEDAEAELGFPRGWTDIGDPDGLPWRWQALRDTVSGCLIQDIFQTYLGKRPPVPQPLEPYA